MDNQQLFAIIFESIKLEENVSRLYLLFSKLYSEDAQFWSTLCKEEAEHAAIYKKFIEKLLPLSLFPEEIIDTDLKRIKANNAMLEKEMNGFLVRHKNKLDAYSFAVQIEEIASEAIFQDGMVLDSDNESLFFLQRINKDSVDHKQRILKLISAKNRALEKI